MNGRRERGEERRIESGGLGQGEGAQAKEERENGRREIGKENESGKGNASGRGNERGRKSERESANKKGSDREKKSA